MERMAKYPHPKILANVKHVLMTRWHPIGAPVPSDEYDSYAFSVAGMLSRGCTALDLFSYLSKAETKILGRPLGDPNARFEIVDELMTLKATGA